MNELNKIVNENMRFQMQTCADLFDEKEIMRILDEENQQEKEIESLKAENMELKKRLGMVVPDGCL